MRVLFVGLALVLAACAGRTPAAMAPPPLPSIEQQLGSLKARLLVLVEQERHRLDAGAKTLVIDPELMDAAQAHSDEMARKQSSADNNPDGPFAVSVLLRDPKFGGYVAENSAVQYFTPGTGIDSDNYARSIVAVWLASPDHKNNLAYAPFDRTGIGLAANGGAIYVALVLATDYGILRR